MQTESAAPRAKVLIVRNRQEPPIAGLAEQARMLADGSTSSLELTERALNRISELDGRLNAFRVVFEQSARGAAAEADRRLAAGERLPLLGVPIAVKDDTDIAGETTAFGCPGNFTPAVEDAEVVRRLRAAGAVIVGKTNSPEIGQWPVTAGPTFGITRNPWSLDHTPGGSSGGSAAAVAAGILAAAVGSDGAGSIRIPAAWTGLVGIKPQRGRVSTWPDAESFNGLAVIGPLARTVRDAALLLDVLAGSHPGDRHRPEPLAEPFTAYAEREPGPLRIALSTRIPYSGVPTRLDGAVSTRVGRIAGVLAGLGHEVIVASPRYGLSAGAMFMPRSMAGLREWSARVPEIAALDPRTQHNVKLGRLLGGPLLRLTRAAEPLLHRQIGAIFRKADVVLAPTTALPPLKANALEGLSSWDTDKVVAGACPYAWPWNVLGWPGINVPAGFTSDGLPIGAQLLGPANSEPLLISLAAQLEATERWHDHWPEIATELPDAAGIPLARKSMAHV